MNNIDNKEGTEGRYLLTPQVEANLTEVLPHVDDKLGDDIKDFVCSLRENIQGDVTTSFAYFTKAFFSYFSHIVKIMLIIREWTIPSTD